MVEFPERDEIVVAVVTKIMPYGAFCRIPEYNIDAFMHVSQVASGWVKNIHEFLSDGQRLVVKIHHVNPEKNQVDISLKSVTDDEKRRKLDEIRRIKRGDKLLEISIKNSKLRKIKLEEAKEKIEGHFEDLLSCFEECFDGDEHVLDDVDVPKKLKLQIFEVARANIKKSKIVIGGVVNLICPSSDGVKKVKEILSIGGKDIICSYLGAPRYKLSFDCEDYKVGQKKFSKMISKMKNESNKLDCLFEFESDDS